MSAGFSADRTSGSTASGLSHAYRQTASAPFDVTLRRQERAFRCTRRQSPQHETLLACTPYCVVLYSSCPVCKVVSVGCDP